MKYFQKLAAMEEDPILTSLKILIIGRSCSSFLLYRYKTKLLLLQTFYLVLHKKIQYETYDKYIM